MAQFQIGDKVVHILDLEVVLVVEELLLGGGFILKIPTGGSIRYDWPTKCYVPATKAAKVLYGTKR